MEYETLKRFNPAEADFALGKRFVALAAKGIEVDRADLIADLKTHIKTPNSDAKRASFYDFLIEISTLTFVLHKWGLLLFHIDQKMLGNWLLAIEVENDLAIIAQKDNAIVLEKLTDGEEIFSAKLDQKSAIFETLLWLMDKQTALEIISLEEDSARYDGNHVSFNAERLNAQKKELNALRSEFLRYKTRLDRLQELFIENFGKPIEV